MDTRSWWSDAERGAAREFGRKHYRGFTALLVVRKLAPFVLTVAAGALLAWGMFLLVRTLAPLFLAAAVLGAVVTAGVAAYRWWSAARLSVWIPSAVVCLIGVAGFIVLVLR